MILYLLLIYKQLVSFELNRDDTNRLSVFCRSGNKYVNKNFSKGSLAEQNIRCVGLL